LGALGSARLGWGILGTGRIAGEFALALRRLPSALLVAIGSREQGRAEALARAVGASRAHGSYEALVADPGVDVVYVATPNSRHRDHCILALSAGKAVLCEKPFALNAIEARAVAEVARRERRFCMEAMWSRFVPAVERALSIVRDGQIGDPLAFQADFGIRVASRDNRVFRLDLGGGSVLDLGVYLVSMARLFLGPTQEVCGQALLGPSGVDEQAAMILRHRGGGQSVLFASVLGETRGEATLLGTRGRLRIHAPFYKPHRLSVERFAEVFAGPALPRSPSRLKQGLRLFYQRFEGIVSPFVRRPALELFDPVAGNGYHYQAVEVMARLRAGEIESPRMPLDESIATLETLDGLRAQWGVRFPGEVGLAGGDTGRGEARPRGQGPRVTGPGEAGEAASPAVDQERR